MFTLGYVYKHEYRLLVYELSVVVTGNSTSRRRQWVGIRNKARWHNYRYY